MNEYEKWNDRYRKKWCTKSQLKRLITLNVITEEQYKGITGEENEE